MSELSPPAAGLADLAMRMLQDSWPTTDDDRREFFQRHGLEEIERGNGSQEPRASDSAHHWLQTSLASIDGTSAMFGDEFLGLSLFCYNQPISNGAQAKEAYTQLKRLLTEQVGEPAEEWGTPQAPACFWAYRELQLDMYCFHDQHSGLMISLSHTARSAANDAAADAQAPI